MARKKKAGATAPAGCPGAYVRTKHGTVARVVKAKGVDGLRLMFIHGEHELPGGDLWTVEGLNEAGVKWYKRKPR